MITFLSEQRAVIQDGNNLEDTIRDDLKLRLQQCLAKPKPVTKVPELTL